MQKIAKIILCISICVNIILGIVFLRPDKKVNTEFYKHNIDSLEHDIDSLHHIRDSIKLEIDTVYVNLTNNIKQYEKNNNVILNYSASEDYCYFTSYIKWNRERLDNIVNSNSIKGN